MKLSKLDPSKNDTQTRPDERQRQENQDEMLQNTTLKPYTMKRKYVNVLNNINVYKKPQTILLEIYIHWPCISSIDIVFGVLLIATPSFMPLPFATQVTWAYSATPSAPSCLTTPVFELISVR